MGLTKSTIFIRYFYSSETSMKCPLTNMSENSLESVYHGYLYTGGGLIRSVKIPDRNWQILSRGRIIGKYRIIGKDAKTLCKYLNDYTFTIISYVVWTYQNKSCNVASKLLEEMFTPD